MRRTLGHRLNRIEDGRKLLVIDFDQRKCLFGSLFVNRCNGRNGLSDVSDLLLGKNVLVVPGRRYAVHRVGYVGAGYDRNHTLESSGLRGVDPLDTPVGYG